MGSRKKSQAHKEKVGKLLSEIWQMLDLYLKASCLILALTYQIVPTVMLLDRFRAKPKEDRQKMRKLLTGKMRTFYYSLLFIGP